jgi:hypothetical protein
MTGEIIEMIEKAMDLIGKVYVDTRDFSDDAHDEIVDILRDMVSKLR